MHVAAQLQQITVFVHHNGFESSLVQMSDPAVPAVTGRGIGERDRDVLD